MRTKVPRVVVAFATGSQAMAVDLFCAKSGIQGRLIPTPSVISAGCGLAWLVADMLDCVETGKLLTSAKLSYETISLVDLY